MLYLRSQIFPHPHVQPASMCVCVCVCVWAFVCVLKSSVPETPWNLVRQRSRISPNSKRQRTRRRPYRRVRVCVLLDQVPCNKRVCRRRRRTMYKSGLKKKKLVQELWKPSSKVEAYFSACLCVFFRSSLVLMSYIL